MRNEQKFKTSEAGEIRNLTRKPVLLEAEDPELG